jgi:DNA repair protein RadC
MTRDELLRRVDEDPTLLRRLGSLLKEPSEAPIETVEDAADILRPLVAGYPEERLALLAIDQAYRPIAATALTRGSQRATIIDPVQVFAWALRQGDQGAAGIILSHNHPSGDHVPSNADIELTDNLVALSHMLMLPILDHIVFGQGGEFTSMARIGVVAEPPGFAEAPWVT